MWTKNEETENKESKSLELAGRRLRYINSLFIDSIDNENFILCYL